KAAMGDWELVPINDFKERLVELHTFAMDYLKDWSAYLEEFKALNLSWIDLKNEIRVSKISFTLDRLMQQGVELSIDRTKLLNEVDSIQLFVADNLERWNDEGAP